MSEEQDKIEQNNIERTEKGTFKKGVSGNPSGKPKGTATPAKHVKTILSEILEAQDFVGLKNLLRAIFNEATQNADMKAAELLLKYYVGTPRAIDTEEVSADGSRSVTVTVVHTTYEQQQNTAEFDEEFDENMKPD